MRAWKIAFYSIDIETILDYGIFSCFRHRMKVIVTENHESLLTGDSSGRFISEYITEFIFFIQKKNGPPIARSIYDRRAFLEMGDFISFHLLFLSLFVLFIFIFWLFTSEQVGFTFARPPIANYRCLVGGRYGGPDVALCETVNY